MTRTWNVAIHEPDEHQPRWTATVMDPDENWTNYAADTEAGIGAKVTWHIERQRRMEKAA